MLCVFRNKQLFNYIYIYIYIYTRQKRHIIYTFVNTDCNDYRLFRKGEMCGGYKLPKHSFLHTHLIDSSGETNSYSENLSQIWP